MKQKLLELFSCVHCHNSDFSLVNASFNENEIRDGEIQCNRCRSIYFIKDGILDLLIDIKENIVEEQSGNLEHFKNVLKNISKYNPNIYNDIYSNEWCYLEPLLLIDGNVFGHEILAVFEEAIKYVNIDEKTVILDLGTGSCWTTNRLSKLSDNVIALDINTLPYIGLKSFELHTKQNDTYYERILVDCNEGLPIKGKSVDLVFISASLHHFLNPVFVLDEIRRVLKNDGLILGIREPICGTFEKDSKFHKNAREREKSIEKAYSLRSYRHILRQGGYDIKVKIKYLQELIQNLEPSELARRIYGDGSYPFKKISNIGRLMISLLHIIRPFFESLFFKLLVYFGGNVDRFKFFTFIYVAYPVKR